MQLALAENIRRYRKDHGLTQQRVADALGVTPGAVYKWEAGLTAPDLGLLVELADLFGTSVDALLGYEMHSSGQADTAARLKVYLRGRDMAGLAEAEKALLRYPNSFDIVHESAELYYNFGLMARDEALLRRAVGLMERSLLLLEQNTDPKISALSIHVDMASAWSSMGDDEKMLEILKKDDPRGINDDMIGLCLAGALDRPEEAKGYLSSALVETLARLIRIVMGYENVFFKQGDFASGRDLIRLALDFFEGFREPDRCDLLDKPCVALRVSLAYAELMTGGGERAWTELRRAKELARRFDQAPSYSAEGMRFVWGGKEYTAFDDLGQTARDSLLKAVHDMDSEALAKMWEEVDRED